jgi:hypothetical protein
MILQTLDELAVHAEDLEAGRVAAPSEPVIQHYAASPDMGSAASLDMIYRENSYVTNTAALALVQEDSVGTLRASRTDVVLLHVRFVSPSFQASRNTFVDTLRSDVCSAFAILVWA